MKPIQIIGGGLAGLSLGCALRRKDVPVTLYERKSYPQHRVCGEFLCGVSPYTIEKLQLKNSLVQAVDVKNLKWFIEEKCIIDQQIKQQACGISRYLLDTKLSQTFTDLGGELITKTTYNETDIEGSVWTTGKPTRKPKVERDKWIGLSIHASNADINSLEMHSGLNGYIGLCPIESGKTNITGLFRKNSKIKGSSIDLICHYLEHNHLLTLATRLKSWEFDPSSFKAIAGFDFGKQPTAGEFCVGDASLLIPPFAGNGMSMALENSALSIDSLFSYSNGDRDWAATVSCHRNASAPLFNKRMRYAHLLHPLLFSKLGHSALKLVAQTKLLPVNHLFHSLR